jgi:hypothetical protein
LIDLSAPLVVIPFVTTTVRKGVATAVRSSRYIRALLAREPYDSLRELQVMFVNGPARPIGFADIDMAVRATAKSWFCRR